LGNQISTDARFFSIQEKEPLIRFSATGAQHDDVITHVDTFASQIKREVFKRADEPTTDIPSLEKPSQDSGLEQSSLSGLAVGEAERAEDDRWQSSIFRTQFNGLAVGDVDGNGVNECVVIDKNRIYVYRFEKDRLVTVAEFQQSRHNHLLNVDVADINDNGKAEIFITNYAKISEQPNSFIIEHGEDGFSSLAENTKWYYRVISESVGKTTLLAQKQADNTLFSDSIHVLAFVNDHYVSVEKVTPPKKFSVYEMILAADIENHDRVFIAYMHHHEIAALSPEGEIFWSTGEEFDGSLIYFEYTDQQFQEIDRHYLPQRILFMDTDGNGKPEIIAVRNIDSNRGIISRLKRYEKGYISCMEWRAKHDLRLKWKTVQENGYISDLAVADVTNDGKLDLIFTVVIQTGSWLKKSFSSYLIIQQLP
jgi:hypothetical protein